MTLPFVITLRKSASLATRVSDSRARSRAKERIAEALSTCVLRTMLLSRMSVVVVSKLSLAVSMNDVWLSISRVRSSPPSLNAAPNSRDDRPQVLLRHRVDEALGVEEPLRGLDRDRGVGLGDLASRP